MGKYFTKKALCSFFVFLLGGHLIFADVIYVDIDATGDNDGSHWSDAFTSLSEALDTAQSGDEIWVAGGTYRPTDGIVPAPEVDVRELTFQLKNGVIVKGGYAGDAGRPFIRDIYEHTTILSGDIGDNETNTDNSYHVVMGADNTVLDGFTIRHGYSVNAPAGPDSYGTGMYNYMDANLTVSNCRFEFNSARFGGGMYSYESDVTLTNCVFCDNSAVYNGGGLREVDGVSVVTNCTFYRNQADTESQDYVGGGIASLDSDSVITNCIFSANSDNGGVDESAQIDSSGGVLVIRYSCIQGLDIFMDVGNIDADPLFHSTGRSDLFLNSQAGSWVSTGFWMLDAVTSPCIDAGDPDSPIGLEPFANGGRVNMGAYGGTEKSSKSYFGTTPCETIMAGDINGDCAINLLDFMIMAEHWLWEE